MSVQIDLKTGVTTFTDCIAETLWPSKFTDFGVKVETDQPIVPIKQILDAISEALDKTMSPEARHVLSAKFDVPETATTQRLALLNSGITTITLTQTYIRVTPTPESKVWFRLNLSDLAVSFMNCGYNSSWPHTEARGVLFDLQFQPYSTVVECIAVLIKRLELPADQALHSQASFRGPFDKDAPLLTVLQRYGYTAVVICDTQIFLQ